jgi:hypothetical protein
VCPCVGCAHVMGVHQTLDFEINAAARAILWRMEKTLAVD